MSEPWKDAEPWEPESSAAVAPTGWHTDLNLHAIHAMACIRQLGVIKPGEKISPLHKWDCPYPKNYAATCTCPGGPEIVFADWNELMPAYLMVDRFIER
jgi:hypothetical protein